MTKTTETKAKRLTIKLDTRTPQYTFEGRWTGKDVITTMNNMRRAYLRHQKQVRKELSVEEKETTR